jgi:excisionase family DNA binding protein
MTVNNFDQHQIEKFYEMLMVIDSKLDSIRQPVTQPIWLTTKEAAKVLGVTTRTLQTYRDQSMIPFSQFGREVRYRAEDIQEFLMRHHIRPKNWEGGVS